MNILHIATILAALLLQAPPPSSVPPWPYQFPILQEQRKRRAPRKGVRSQRDVALVLGLSERAVRAIERRALAKLRRDPALQRLVKELGWHDLGERTEQPLTLDEIRALIGLTQNAEEGAALIRILLLIAQDSN